MRNEIILLVDDDPILLPGIRSILEIEGFQVLTAENGVDALKVLNNSVDIIPDIIISDVMMPEMDGFELLQNIREREAWIHIPFIFLTAKGETPDRHKGELMGADVYIKKPFDTKDLLVAVEARLRRSAAMSKAREGEIHSLKKRMMEIINHEFRTPLSLIVGYADMLRDGPNEISDEELPAFLNGVYTGADRLKRLVENFITLVDVDNGQASKMARLQAEPIQNLEHIMVIAVNEVISEYDPKRVIFERDDLIPMIYAYRDHVRIIIRELVDNALKFSKDKVIIRIHDTEDQKMVEIQVEDRGAGIKAEVIDEIWKPFYQYNRESLESQGAGSGLTIVAGLTHANHGQYWVKSEENVGSLFIVRLPQA